MLGEDNIVWNYYIFQMGAYAANGSTGAGSCTDQIQILAEKLC